MGGNMRYPAEEDIRGQALAYFAEQLPHLESTTGLWRAALAISMHALDDVDPVNIDAKLDSIVAEVRQRYDGNDPKVKLAHLHAVLFDESKFHGDMSNYYNALNSYLPVVLERRQGLPITLSLLYKVVAERIGLEVCGVNAPAHFLVLVHDGQGGLYVDPFFGGQFLTLDEALDRIETVLQRPIPTMDHHLPIATHREWLDRILRNLLHVMELEEREQDLQAFKQFQRLLHAG